MEYLLGDGRMIGGVGCGRLEEVTNSWFVRRIDWCGNVQFGWLQSSPVRPEAELPSMY